MYIKPAKTVADIFRLQDKFRVLRVFVQACFPALVKWILSLLVHFNLQLCIHKVSGGTIGNITEIPSRSISNLHSTINTK